MRVNSKHLCPGTLSVDAFALDWAGEFNWLVPPVYLIGFAHLNQAAKRF